MFLFVSYSVKHSLLLIIGFGLGVSLYHAAFGFTGAWRRFIINKQGNGIRAQLFAIAFASLLILPLLKSENYFGSVMVGSFGPIGISVLIGSFIFGLGMQLGGGCGSGTLFTVGSGNVRMMITLISFIVGSVLGTLHLPWWLSLPSLSYLSLSEIFWHIPKYFIPMDYISLDCSHNYCFLKNEKMTHYKIFTAKIIVL